MSESSRRTERRADRELQGYLAGGSLHLAGQSTDQRDPPLEVADRLLVCRAGRRVLARPLVLGDGLLDESRRLVVPRDHLRRRGRRGGELLHQHLRDAGVELAARALEQRLVSGLLHEGVLEDVCRVGREPAGVDQLGLHQPGERRLQLGVREARCGPDEPVGELPADRRRDLGHLLGGPQPIEPRHQGVLEGRGDRARRSRLVPLFLQHRLGELFDEERHPVGAEGDRLHQLVEARGASRDAGHHLAHVAATQATEGHVRLMRQQGPRGPELRPSRAEDQHGRRLAPLDQHPQQLERRRVDPLEILDHEDRGLDPREADDPADHRGEEAPPLRLGGERERGIPIRKRQTQQRGHERHGVGRRQVHRGEGTLEADDLLLDRFVSPPDERLTEDLGHRIEGGVLVVRRSSALDPHVRLAGQVLPEALREPGLPDPRLARDDDDLTRA